MNSVDEAPYKDVTQLPVEEDNDEGFWVVEQPPFTFKYPIMRYKTVVPFHIRLWFMLSNPFTYALFGYLRW